MNLIQSLQADLGILDRLDEADEVVDRSGKLTDDIGERHHHTQRHIAMNDVTGCNERNENIGGLAEENKCGLFALYLFPNFEFPRVSIEKQLIGHLL